MDSLIFTLAMILSLFYITDMVDKYKKGATADLGTMLLTLFVGGAWGLFHYLTH